MLDTGLTEEQLNALKAATSGKLDEFRLLDPEKRIAALLGVLWEDAHERGITPAKLAMMAMGAWQRMQRG